jgi:hypothetical protein
MEVIRGRERDRRQEVRVGDIVALIDAALTQARRVGSNPAITSAPVTAPSGAPLFCQPTVQHEAGRFAPHRSCTRTPRALPPSG